LTGVGRLWKGLAVKRGWRLPAELPGGEPPPGEDGGNGSASSSGNGQRSGSPTSAKGARQRYKELLRQQRGRPSVQRSKADDSYLTKGRAVGDDDDAAGSRNRQGGGDRGEGGDGGGQWKEWYVQTLHRRVKRSMRECEGDEEEARWRHVTEDDGHEDGERDGDGDDEGGVDGSEEENDDSGDDAGDDDAAGKGKGKGKEKEGRAMAKKRAKGKRETDERIGSSGPLKATVSSREDFLQLVKEKAVRSLTKVEIREQEVVLAQFAWVRTHTHTHTHLLQRVTLMSLWAQDTPVQQFGTNKDDLYIVGGTPWGLVNYMLTELSSFGTRL
jgi:hypothetical protein